MLHVPLLVHYPQGFRPRVVAEPVGLVDILPTLRELTRSPREERDEGSSLVPLLQGGPIDPERRPLFAHLLRQDLGGRLLHSVRRGPWKYIESGSGEALLFDLSADPEERKDLTEASPEIAGRLQAGLHGFVRESRKLPARPVLAAPDPGAIERLRSLGYVR
jgi:arylsulfatase A-like enzyme